MVALTSSLMRSDMLSSRTTTHASASSQSHPLAAPGLGRRPAAARVSRRMIVRAADDKGQGNTSTQDPAAEIAGKMASQGPTKLNEALKELPTEQQKAISQLYLFLVQNPSHNINFRGWQDVQRAIAEDYQVLIWRPAELLNGRMAMIGFVMGALVQARTGVSVWGQLNAFPFAYLAAYGLVITGSLLNSSFGRPKEGIEIGPIKFSQQAELLNGRLAMVGYAILAYIGYNQDLAKGIVQLLRVVQANSTGITT